ncbi:MAG: AEC family transporter [Rubrivivax sp.]
MQAILNVTLPFFALVLCGYAAARFRVLPESAIPGLNAFVLFFALPCMLFRFGQSTPVLELLNPYVLTVYVLVALAVVAFTLAVTLSRRIHLKDGAFGALVAAFPNTGFMGVPLLISLLGPAAAGPLICVLLADLFVTSSLCIALAQLHDAGNTASGRRALAWKAARGALSNPLPWAIAAGAGLSLAGIRLQGPPEVVVRMLGEAASPVALFTIGAVLWRAGQHAAARTPPGLVWPVALIKLFLHPLLVLLASGVARSLGAPLTGFQVTVMTLAAALPSASNVSLLAERYQADTGRIARIIMSSTALAFITFTALAASLGIRPTG